MERSGGLRAFALSRLLSVLPDRLTDASARWVRAQAAGAPTSLAAAIERGASGDVALLVLAEALRLSAPELVALALAALVEEEPMLGRALAAMQAPVGGSRPTLGLLAAALGGDSLAALAYGEAARQGVLARVDDGAPLPEQALRLPEGLHAALLGRDPIWPGVRFGLDPRDEVPLDPASEARAVAAARGLAAQPGWLALRSGSRAEARTFAARVAGAMGLRPVFFEGLPPPAAGPALRVRGGLPVLQLGVGPGERAVTPAGLSEAGLVIGGQEGNVTTHSGSAEVLTLPVPDRAARAALWRAALGPEVPVEALASRRQGCGRIHHLARLARRRAAQEGRPVGVEDVAAAAWRSEDGALETLAQPVRAAVGEGGLVLPPALIEPMRALEARCRQREVLGAGLGVAVTGRYAPGVRALFVGPSGTGKTLAASWLAGRLGLPLFRVDLAGVLDKYIGETEKKLAEILAAAEDADVVLLFDEADALFGKRTEVRQANDRFANAQTSYLLQRLESYAGITLLTSNAQGRFDGAFTRRLDAIVTFSQPTPTEARALWLAHLGDAHALAPRDLNRLAATVDLAGGHVRNAVLAAAALAEGRPVGWAELVAGVHDEYRKLGRTPPSGLSADLPHPPR